MRKVLMICWLIMIFTGIGYLFWYHEWKYSLPTPVPENYTAIKTGELINVTDKISVTDGKPVFIHFFNPDCPCSRFNIPHFNSLVKQYGSQLSFSVVVLNKTKQFTAKEIQERYDLTVPVSFDTTIASICGVYSTPQAVILDEQHRLYYRGNYNKSRYCTEKNSNYAQMAIDSLLNHDTQPIFSHFALTAYGCSLPTCTK
jgi:hypothetical protein